MKLIRQIIICSLAIVLTLGPLFADDIQCIWKDAERIVAVGDIHGDYENFVQILKGIGLVNDDLDWIGGATHLVQTGDVMDRGPDAREAFDLLKKLEKEAPRYGGMVHVLLGNHEEANLVGIAFDYPGYVTPEQFADFLPKRYRRSREKSIRKKYKNNESPEIPLQQALNEYWYEMMQTDIEARRTYLEHFHDEYGKWLLDKNAVIKINDIIFVHGGISPEFSTWELQKINDQLRKELTAIWHGVGLVPEIVFDSEAPLWFRDLILWDEKQYAEQVDTILANLGASHIVMGHTVREDALAQNPSPVLSRFNGKVWGIDTGISDFYGGVLSALRIQNGEFKVWLGEQK